MDFASRISVTCFVASYMISLVNEILRAFWPRWWVRWLATGGALAGITAQTLFLVHISVSQQRLPIKTQFESLITVSWLISLIYLYLLIRDRRLAAGLFILPVSLGLVLFACTLPVREYTAPDQKFTVIATAHGMLLLFGTVMVVAALVVALMYLVKVKQLKAGALQAGLRLPSLERLDRVNTVSVWMAWALLSVGLSLSLVLQFTSSRALSWSDPKLLATWSAWLLFTFLVHYRYHPENRGRRVAILTIIACAVVLVSVLGDPIFGTGHQTLPEVGA